MKTDYWLVYFTILASVFLFSCQSETIEKEDRLIIDVTAIDDVFPETQGINIYKTCSKGKDFSNKNLETYVISESDDLIGFFELLYNPDLKETEISYFGLLEEYIGRGIGGYALSEEIKKSFEKNIKRVWCLQKYILYS